MIDPVTDDGFEVLPPTEEPEIIVEEKSTPVRKLCACGCGEEVTGLRALKRGHSMGTGLQMSSFAPEDVLMVQAAFSGMFMGGTAWIGMKRGIPGMEVEEAQALANPAGRMFVRHFPKQLLRHMKPGDISDGIAILAAVSMYTMRVGSTNKSNSTGVVNANGYHADSTVSGLTQYQYTPPEQTIQQENVSTDRSRQ
jgi:hypothetical protein